MFFCFSAFFLLIFTDICSARATTSARARATLPPIFQAAKEEDCSKCPKHDKPMDCAELLENGVTESGVHTVYPRSRISTCKSIDVYCDMETDGGGWTVIQRRGQYGNGENYFVKKWKEYKEGFGNMKKEFWLGNDQIHSLTNQGHYSVRMDMTDESGKKAFTLYENFWIENEQAKYKLHISDASGPGGDAISNHDGYAFYAVDQPNYAGDDKSTRSGGWWRNNRKTSSLNGLNLYKTDKVGTEDGINWGTFGGFKTSFEATEIKIRSKKFQGRPENVAKP
ncbi:Techylectin-5A [Araneus ventricosus]|uniref:Techylectin-5A n=1 Tax=Araneus ventricosus TaxID=182803 RepID=A0A4Y2R238_ARAVE|nr:Techylectin-5A [Araneus ventricosus]GBN69742.1 Techylectin-5A [Araneus ventricosus]